MHHEVQAQSLRELVDAMDERILAVCDVCERGTVKRRRRAEERLRIVAEFYNRLLELFVTRAKAIGDQDRRNAAIVSVQKFELALLATVRDRLPLLDSMSPKAKAVLVRNICQPSLIRYEAGGVPEQTVHCLEGMFEWLWPHPRVGRKMWERGFRGMDECTRT